MTSLAAADRPPVAVVPTAAQAYADRLAAGAGVRVELVVEPRLLDQVSDLFVEVWAAPQGQPQVSPDLMRALAHVGGYTAAAYEGSDLVAACVGFFGHPEANVLHSHIAGVTARVQGRAVGHALKAHQYAWAAQRGLAAVTWTFDPLQSRNAWFNLVKLGAHPVAYLPDFYGEMHDGVNVGQGSDRLYLSWPVTPDGVPSGSGQAPADAIRLLGVDDDGRPVPRSLSADAATVLVAVPRAISSLREQRPELGREWRVAVRESLGGLIADGGRVTGFTRAGDYVVEVGR